MADVVQAVTEVRVNTKLPSPSSIVYLELITRLFLDFEMYFIQGKRKAKSRTGIDALTETRVMVSQAVLVLFRSFRTASHLSLNFKNTKQKNRIGPAVRVFLSSFFPSLSIFVHSTNLFDSNIDYRWNEHIVHASWTDEQTSFHE